MGEGQENILMELLVVLELLMTEDIAEEQELRTTLHIEMEEGEEEIVLMVRMLVTPVQETEGMERNQIFQEQVCITEEGEEAERQITTTKIQQDQADQTWVELADEIMRQTPLLVLQIEAVEAGEEEI